MFARQRSPGLWTFDSVVEGDEFEYIDESLSNALDMLDGGAYSVQGSVVVGGAPGVDWRFTLPLQCDSDFVVYGIVTFFNGLTVVGECNATDLNANSLDIYGPADFHGITTFHDPTYYQSLAQFLGNCEMFGNVYVGNTDADLLLVSATADFESQASFNDPVHFYDTVTFHGTNTFQGATAFNGGGVSVLTTFTLGVPMQFTLDGRIPKRQVQGVDNNTSYSPRNYDTVYVPAGGIGADREYSIDDTGAVNGDRMRFVNLDVTRTLAVKTGITYLANLRNIAGIEYWCDVERLGGVWRKVASGPNP